jgi:hypothetical protein
LEKTDFLNRILFSFGKKYSYDFKMGEEFLKKPRHVTQDPDLDEFFYGQSS